MALTRKMLKAMGIEEEKIDQIIEAHTETVDALKEKAKTYEEKANQLEAVEKELDELKANNTDDYKEKYEKEHNSFEAYKKDVAAKETKAAKESAVKAYFESKNITGANLAIAMRGAHDEIAGIELDGTSIKDTSALDALVTGEFAGLVVTKSKQGANTANPPGNTGGGKMTKEEILQIKDASERQRAIAENLDLFGKG